tara:strand:+ start:617 stop:1069 length:453 start_codon:yes stop_codon:yes gene_type:complete
MIESNKINDFLNSWKDGIIRIGKVYLENGDYKRSAEKFVETHYAFDSESVLFKPTFTKEVIFRNSKDKALSYFIGGNIDEDHGFALKPWEKISIDELNILEENELKISMGIFKLKPVNKKEIISVAFTFVLTENNDTLKIKVHHSSPIII